MTNQTKSLPKFQGKPLVEIPSYNPDVDFLRGDFGKEVDQEVKDLDIQIYQIFLI